MNTDVSLMNYTGSYEQWRDKYRADGARELQLELASIERRRAAGLLQAKECRSGDDYEIDAAHDAIPDEDHYCSDGDEGRWLGGEL